jgi:hypothetical protein
MTALITLALVMLCCALVAITADNRRRHSADQLRRDVEGL